MAVDRFFPPPSSEARSPVLPARGTLRGHSHDGRHSRLGYVISEFAKRFSGAGAVYEFLAHTIGKKAAIFGAAAYFLAYAFLVGDYRWPLAARPCRSGKRSSIKTSRVDLRCRAHRHRHGHQRIRYHVLGARAVDGRRAVDHPFMTLSIVVISKGGVSGNHFSVFEPNHIAAAVRSSRVCSLRS